MSKPFPWRPGTRAIDNRGNAWRLYVGSGDLLCAQGEPGGYCSGWLTFADLMGARPDETDPATLGALLGVLREERGDPTIYVRPVYSMQTAEHVGWQVGDQWQERLACGPTEFAALMAALEATP